MMPTMMFGMETYMFLWLVLITLICFLLIGICVWLMAGWLKKQRTPPMQDTPQPRDAYEGYEQGYQPQQQPPEMYQEGGHRYPYPQNDHSQAPYQAIEQVRHER